MVLILKKHKNIREKPLDRALAKMQKYMRDNALTAVLLMRVLVLVLGKLACTQKNWKKYEIANSKKKLEKSCDNIVAENEKNQAKNFWIWGRKIDNN